MRLIISFFYFLYRFQAKPYLAVRIARDQPVDQPALDFHFESLTSLPAGPAVLRPPLPR